ncbi:hypothetical protein ACVWXU_001170 [Streptomyces sp. TE33382]
MRTVSGGREASGAWTTLRVPAALCLLLALLLTAALPAAADTSSAAPADECRSSELATARVSTWVLLEHGNRTYIKVRTELRVEVRRDWPLARDLLLSENSPAYIRAMACLTRTHVGQQRRWSEWRDGPPVVTSEKDGGVTVTDRTHAWVNVYGWSVDTGVWRVRAGKDRWTIRLLPPRALTGARWSEIKVDPGEPGAETATPRPDGGEGTTALIWHPAAPDKKPGKEKPGGERRPADPNTVGEKTPTTDPVPAVTVRIKPS